MADGVLLTLIQGKIQRDIKFMAKLKGRLKQNWQNLRRRQQRRYLQICLRRFRKEKLLKIIVIKKQCRRRQKRQG